MDYEIQELFRQVGTYGVTKEQAIELFTEYLAWKQKVNVVMKTIRDEQMKNVGQSAKIQGETIAQTTQG